jgi:pimeloyl-ACP methyl ester carboxylesterase
VEHFSSFDGTQIAYTTGGAGPGVLLLHGFGADHIVNWVRPGIVDALVASGRRVIAYDARGHGKSGKPHDPAAYENDAMVRDARCLLDHIGADAVDVVGYSMGAIVSSRLAAIEPRVRSLVLGGIGGRVGRAADEDRRARIAAALEARAGERRSDDAEARAFRHFTERGGNDLGALAAIQRATSNGRTGVLKSIAVPTLVVAGADDGLAGSPQELAARIEGAIAQVVPGNHLSAVGRAEFTAAIVDFLASASPNS